MDKKVYIITNCGSIVSVFDDKDEMNEEYGRLWEQEQKYQVTHYYYGTEEMTRAEFVCNRICGKYEEYIRRSAKGSCERLGMTEEEAYHHFYRIWHCNKCALKAYSPHITKEEQDENA